MKKHITLTVKQVVLSLCLLVVISAGLGIGAQWRYDLISTQSSPSPIALGEPNVIVTDVPSVFQSSSVIAWDGMYAADILAIQSRLPSVNDLWIDPREDNEFLQTVLDTIFPAGVEGFSEEEKAIEILRYTPSKLELKSKSGSLATEFLKDGYGDCGGMSIVFRTLARKVDLPTRFIYLFGVVDQGNHTLVEVYYDGQWHLFDPTFGLFFYSEPEYNQNGKVPALKELLGNTSNWYLYKVVDQPWTGRYDEQIRSFGVVRAPEDYLAAYYGYPFVASYRQMFETTFPISYGYEEHVLSFPVVADFSVDSSFSVGEVDDDYMDVAIVTAGEETAGKVGHYSFLKNSAYQLMNTWFITAPSPGFVRITYYSTEDAPPLLILFPLKAVYVVDSKQEGNKAEFILRISDPEASIQFMSNDGMYWIDAVEAQWLGETTDSFGNP